ncbi:unnamed protein product [Rhizoctonia solani]|uniref:Uncharacterized protein n=1 Tax=Rhizoctonia solani TaxID=456999 RepID=A0A8H3E9R8_9AGAM|nr:unnamed protein product [Rhizoctonia solani]
MEKGGLSEGWMMWESIDRRNQDVQPSRRRVITGKLWLAASALVAGWHLHRLVCKPSMHMAPIPHTDKIEWTNCGDNFECGRLLVPLDYHNKSLGHANLAVGRYLAKNRTSRLGSLFVNPGGPGGSGVSFLQEAGPVLAALLDDRYDIVSWDPRGVNGTTPRIDCFASQTDQDIAFAHTYQDVGFEARNLSDPIDRAVYAQQVRKADAEKAVVAELCLNRTGEALRHVGTATVVRDLELLSRVIEGPEKLVNYWGFSYGTVVGSHSDPFVTSSYFVNMFPERVGRVIIDGVVDPVRWTTVGVHKWSTWDLVDTEKVYTNFINTCAKVGPERCALNTNKTSTPTAIRKVVDEFLNDLYERPLPVPHGEQPYILTSGMVRNLIFVHMYRPRGWPTLAEQLAAGIRGDGAPIINAMLNTIELNTTKKAETAMAVEAVICVDGPELYGAEPQETVEAMVEENVLTYERVSTHFAALEMALVWCHHWRSREAERYVGPFNHTTLANEILVIGNTADPVTPVVNARAVNRRLPQSRLIVQDGSGHCSLAMASTCTVKAIRGYFLDGVLPPNGTVCDTVERLFPEKEAPAEAKAWLSPEASLSESDAQLAEAMRNLGIAMEPFVGLHKKPRSLL